MDFENYYKALALAYVRGKCPELVEADDSGALEVARAKGLRLHRFKRATGLPRVSKVIGALKSYNANTLLDIGSGRGVFLWPLLDEISNINVTAIDILEHRVDDINAVRKGGFDRVRAEKISVEKLPWPDNSFDAVTALEVLEHVLDLAPAVREILRVAGNVVIASVPSKEDDNPEHIRQFSRDRFVSLFKEAGAKNVQVEYVLGHMIAIVKP